MPGRHDKSMGGPSEGLLFRLSYPIGINLEDHTHYMHRKYIHDIGIFRKQRTVIQEKITYLQIVVYQFQTISNGTYDAIVFSIFEAVSESPVPFFAIISISTSERIRYGRVDYEILFIPFGIWGKAETFRFRRYWLIIRDAVIRVCKMINLPRKIKYNKLRERAY